MAAQRAEGAIAMLPLFFGLAAHGLCIRFGALLELTRPISTRLFGANKTYRGILCVALGTALGFVLVRPTLLARMDTARLAFAGLCVGAAAMTAELPNSFLKRRLGRIKKAVTASTTNQRKVNIGRVIRIQANTPSALQQPRNVGYRYAADPQEMPAAWARASRPTCSPAGRMTRRPPYERLGSGDRGPARERAPSSWSPA